MVSPQNEQNARPAPPSIEATLHILQRDGSVIEREIQSSEFRIGKGPQNDIILNDASVSGTHAMITFGDERFMLTDLGSRNGTLLNEARLTEARPLEHGDLIKMGHCTITFRIKGAETTQSVSRTVLLDHNAPPPPPPAPPSPKTAAITEESLAEALVSARLISQAEINRMRGTDGKGRRLARAIVEEKLISEIGLRDLMSRTFNIAPVEVKVTDIDPAMATALRPQFLRDRMMCPVTTPQPDNLMLVVADPTDRSAIEEAERITRKKASIRLALPSEIQSQLSAFFTPRLIGLLPSGEKVEMILNHSETEIGKAPHNRLILNEVTVSSTHAIIIARSGGFSIADLGSSNGTFINGRKLGHDAHTLQHGDKIQLGQVVLTFRNPAETTENKTARLSPEMLEEIRKRAMTRTLQAPPGVRTDPNSWAPPQPVIAQPAYENGEEKAEKKKKKDKDKEKDKNNWFSANSLSRIVAQVMGALVSLVGTILVVKFGLQQNQVPDKGGNVNGSGGTAVTRLLNNGNWTKFGTGFFGDPLEASGVQMVPGSNGALIVSDNRKTGVVWMVLDEKGNQSGALTEVPLGVTFKDPEAITYGNGYYYLVTSQGDPKDGPANALVRFDFNPQTQSLRGQAEIINDLRSYLLQNVTAISSLGAPSGMQGGLNIEGIAWDPNNERLLLGLRSPQIGNQAIIVPLKLRDPRGPFNVENIRVDDPAVIVLSLDGQGVRDITYDPQLKNFLIISGAPETSPKTDFVLWEWSGQPDSKPTKLLTLDDKMKPEGIASARIAGQPYVFVAGDAGSYLRLDYATK
jgi:pSer/pThr/pTyr-binding forkhead associated (FHA) protein